MYASARDAAVMSALYEAIFLLRKAKEQSYMSVVGLSLIAPAAREIEQNFTDSHLTAADLAALCDISEGYFRKIFFHCFGVFPKEYIIKRRMEYARQLFDLGEFAASKIARLCGYSEPCHFSREFKKRYGDSPKHYL